MRRAVVFRDTTRSSQPLSRQSSRQLRIVPLDHCRAVAHLTTRGNEPSADSETTAITASAITASPVTGTGGFSRRFGGWDDYGNEPVILLLLFVRIPGWSEFGRRAQPSSPWRRLARRR